MRGCAVTRVLMSALAVLGATSAAEAGELANPSAEQLADGGGGPAGWQPNAWGTVVASFTYASGARDGERALRVDVSAAGAADTGDAKWLSSPFVPTPGTQPYVVSDWYRANVPTRLLVNMSDGAGRSEWTVIASPPAADAWTEARGTVVVPSWVSLLTVVHTIDRVGWLETDAYGAARAELKPPLVSITFDDGWRSAYDDLVPRMDALHMRGTHFVISGFMNRAGLGDLYLNKRDVVSLMNRGHEVQSHTTLHQDLATLDPLDLTAALAGSRSDLEALGGGPVVGLAFPFGSFTPAVRDRAAELYPYARKLGGGPNVVPYDVHELHSTVVDNTFTVDELATTLHGAQAVDGWTILVFHRSADDAPLDTFVKPQVFQDMLDLLVGERAVVKPMGEVLGLWRAPTDPIPVPSDEVVGDPDAGPPPGVDDGHPSASDGAVPATPDAADAARDAEDAAAEAAIAAPPIADVAVMPPDRTVPAPPPALVDAEVYASYRTPPREPERDPVGCAIARAEPRTAGRGIVALALALALAWRRAVRARR